LPSFSLTFKLSAVMITGCCSSGVLPVFIFAAKLYELINSRLKNRVAVASGKSIVKNAKELRVKESDRIKAVVDNLNRCGIATEEFEDGFAVIGGVPKSANIESFGDHRIAMSFAILGLIAGIQIDETDSIQTSFPNFIELLEKITKVENEN
jgi:3-phosphoshikimate 1-carboxyvinyltransferase